MLNNLVKKVLQKEMTQEEFYSKYARDISSKMSASGVRKKAYVDIMGILAILNYLKEQGFECKTERSLHKSPSILEEFEITDIYYNNYRIDVITNFNTNITKIPKIHTDYDIMPDFYIVIKMAQNLNDFRILGYVKPEDVVMSYHDSKYYYPDKRFPIKDLFKIITNERKSLPSLIDKHANCETMFLRFIEGTLSSENKKIFIKHLTTCESCTKSFNFFEKYHRDMKNIEQYPFIYQNLYDKVISFNPVLYKKVKKENNKQNYVSKFIHKVYDFSDNTIEFISNLSWDEEKKEDSHKNMTKKQEVEYIFREKPNFNIEAFSNLFKKRKVGILISVVVLVVSLSLIGLVSFGLNGSKMKFDDSNITSSEDIENMENGLGYNDFSDKGKSYDYEGFEINPVEYNGSNAPNSQSDIIKNVSWEVPAKISDNEEYLGFLQAVGKNIKLRLENDLVMSKDIPKNKNIKADVQFSSEASVMGIKIVKSSGSNMIDDLIQKNIFQAFTYLDSPNIGKETITLTLVIDL